MRISALLFAVIMMFMLPFSAGSGESAAADAPVIVLRVADYGEIYLELYPEYAPLTVENFLRLVDSGFYNGLTFHRIISGFMAQGGCPLGNGTGSSGTSIKGEFSSNGVDNPLKHERGVVSMARSGDPDSASCQFFIMHADAPHLDGSYAAFGRVLSGMGIVDAICRNAHVIDSNGSVPGEDQPVITEAARADRAEAEAASAREAENGSEEPTPYGRRMYAGGMTAGTICITAWISSRRSGWRWRTGRPALMNFWILCGIRTGRSWAPGRMRSGSLIRGSLLTMISGFTCFPETVPGIRKRRWTRTA